MYPNLLAVLMVVIWGVFLPRPGSSDSEKICWRSIGDVAILSISGIPVPVEFVGVGGTSELVDMCVEGEIPHPICISRLAPWVHSMSSHHYRDLCRNDFNGDGTIGLDDLALAISSTLSGLGDACAP